MKKNLLFILSLLLFVSCKEKKSNQAGKKMQDFIVEISEYARNQNPHFIVIPQNGTELLFDNLDADGKLNDRLIAAVDGFGEEELFFDGSSYSPDQYRLQMALKATSIKFLVADYLEDNSQIASAFQYAEDNGFIAFPRASNNYDYMYIPDSVHHENAADVSTLAQAKNYLYLISTSNYTDKATYLTAIQQTNFDLVIIDAFWNDDLLTATEVASLKTKANGGKRLVVSYMDIGSAENYRYYWKDSWKLHCPNWLKKKYDGYKDEIWVKFWVKEWKDIIYGNPESYTQKLLNCGFDGAYLDNVEAFYSLYHKD